MRVALSNSVFYQRPVALNRRLHARASVTPPTDFRFVANVNAIVVVAMEFFEAARDYPIVFARDDDGTVLPMVVLGLRDGENLFVDAEGHWPVGYLPAFVRRFPFILADTDQDGQFLICVDSDYLDTSGAAGPTACRLFDDAGEETEYLANATAFMRHYNDQFETTRAFAQELDAAGLLTEMSAEVRPDGFDSAVTLGNFLVIDESEFADVSPSMLTDWFRRGQLGWIYAHLLSLGHFTALADRIGERLSADPSARAAID